MYKRQKYIDGMPLGTSHDTGSGIRLGQSVGGKTDHMNRVTAWRMINPPISFSEGLVVNKDGIRFGNEMVYAATLGDAMCENQDGKAYLVLDKELFAKAKIQASAALPFQRDSARLMMYFNAKKRNTIDGLAKIYGISTSNLVNAIDRYNSAARGDKECEFGKSAKDMQEIKSPFYIMDISIDSTLAPLPCLTLGGLMVNEETGEVLNQDNKEIPGLYAAGRTAIGISSNIYVSGLSVADCIFSGRRIGQNL